MRLSRIQQGIISVLLVASFIRADAVAQQAPDSRPVATAGDAHGIDLPVAKMKQETAPMASLGELVELALAQNPEIKAMQHSFDMMRQRVPQAKALPDPMLEYGYAGNLFPVPPFDLQKGDPSSARMLSFSQEIPFPGKRALKGKMAKVEAESEWWNYEQTRLNVVAEVKDAYFEYYFLDKAIDTVNKNKALLEKFAKISEARYSVGKGIQQDVLKAQVEISKLLEQMTLLEQRRQTAVAKINSLLFRDTEWPLGKPEEVKLQPFAQNLGELNELALANYPTLKAQRRRIDREQYGVELAEKGKYPDFNVKLGYQNRPGMPDMYGLSVGVSIPLYFGKKQRPAIAEAASGKAAEQKRLESQTALLLLRVKERHVAATTAERLAKLYGTTIIPQSTLSLESAIAGYEVGTVDFLTLMDNLMTLLTYQLSYYEQVSNVEKAVAQLEPLVGVSLRATKPAAGGTEK
jgi:outer membrane protein, heavy metal efflux system